MNESKQIVLTGISSELGRVLARELARTRGSRIIGTMRRKRTTRDRFPSNVEIIDECDLSKPENCERLAELSARRFKSPLGFVHSVGDFWNHVPFLEFDPEEAAAMFTSHVLTLYNVLQFLVPVMRRNGGASCVAFSCNSVRYNYPWMASFTASKSAVESLIRSLANEYSGDNLRFNSLVLASVKTRKVHESKPRGDFAHFLPPRDVVPVVRFLLSHESYLVNGNAINLFRHSERFYGQGYFQRIAK